MSRIFTLFFAAALGWPAFGADFASEIQPIFAQRCLECHGTDKQKGDLRFDQRDSALQAIDLKKPESSELIRRITTADEDDRMPPDGPPLSAEEVASFQAWIAAGAEFSRHWAYEPLDASPPPAVKNEAWVRNPIDRFVLAKLGQNGIQPAPEADRYTLIKRLSYDLIGLPPTPEETDAFVADDSPDAYANLVARLLDSPHFGERWGRHWLDKARYADSDGYEKDRPRPNAWNYRDWVINAVNDDMPFDQFTTEQLAGDLLPDASEAQRLATAFHRQTLTNTEGGTDKEQFRVEAVFDRTETTCTIWLGLTSACARCHSHKYDTISQAEYYGLFAFFNNGDESTFKLPTSQEAMAKYRQQKAAHDARIAKLDGELKSAKAGHEAVFETWKNRLTAALAGQNPPKFHDLREIAAKSDVAGVEFAVEADGAVQVSGKTPDGPVTYEFSAKTPQFAAPTPVTAIRIDVLTDKRLPRNGPGRVGHGNFVLNEVEASLGGQKLEFAGASADFTQSSFDPAQLIDGNRDAKNGWAIAPQMGKPHHAILRLKEPLETGESTLTVKLAQTYGQQHSIGRFRIRLMTGEERENLAPKEIQPILALAPEKRSAKQNKQLLDHFLQQEFAPSKAAFAKIEAEKKKEPKEPVMQVRIIAQRDAPRQTHVLSRGDFLSPSDAVKEGGFSILPPIQGREPGKLDRLDLANWLMAEENPLPPRVLANHLWTHLFGQGLVRTNDDFGVRGELPSHPKLLDWLGAEFRRLGWSRKRMIETIVTSAAYRQNSAHRPELLEIDATNQLLARQNRFRVQAEIVRDLCLSVSGLLSRKIGGPSVFPPLPPDVASVSYANNFKWATSKGEDRYRRGMYTFFKRTAPHPNLIAFDCPDSNTANVLRRTSNTPIQALTTLNNEVFVEAARALAKRALSLEAADDRERIRGALRLCIARPPADAEIASFQTLLATSRDWYAKNPEAVEKILGEPGNAESAAWVAVARIALNLDELITRE